MRALLGGVVLVLTGALPCAAASVLEGITHVAVGVDVTPPVQGVSHDPLARRVVTALATLRPPVTVDGTSSDRLRLTVTVRSYSSSELRGFPLPFSGTYAIGTVRLNLERAVEIVGSTPRSMSASIWQRERQIATRQSAVRQAIDRAVEELLGELLAEGGRPP